MNTFSKVLSMFLVVVMCFGLFTTGAFAETFDFGDNTTNSAQTEVAGGGFDFSGGSDYTYSSSDAFGAAPAASDSFTYNNAKAADDDSFDMNEEPANGASSVENAAETEKETEKEKVEAGGAFDFKGPDSLANTPYADMGAGATFTVAPQDFNKSAPADVYITADSGTFTGDTFPAGIAYSTSATGANLTTLVQGTHYSLDNANQLKIYASWLKTLSPNTYFFYGKRTDDVPVKLGFVNVNKEVFDTTGVTVTNSPYDKNDDTSLPITITATNPADFVAMEGFGVALSGGGYGHVLSVNEYEIDYAAGELTLTEKYLRSLDDGTYYLIGFPNISDKTEQVTFGKFVVRSGAVAGGAWYVTPDYQVWYSGTDPLTFFSNIFDAAGEDWNYKGYGWDVIVPDIRVSTRSNMSGATSVRIDQYWDLGYGYFMLGQNFLNSLSADETYYLQVIDARHPTAIYTNVVSFRVGPTLRAIDTDKHVINSTRSLRFRSSAPISEVYVGNIQLTDPSDYGVSWDGKTVTLSFEFLNKRSPGNTYTVKVRTTGGEWASTTFQVLTTAQGSASPRTGDESNLGLWAAFLLLSGTAVVVLIPKLRKQDF